VSSGASAQTVQRPTAALQSGFDFIEYTAFPNYTTDGPEIAVVLKDEVYRKSDNEASTDLSLVSFDACVS